MSKILLLALFVLFPWFASAAAININTADVELLDTLPGIGLVKAQTIIDYRTTNGPFLHKEDIQNVSGIGPATYADIEPLITVGTTNTEKVAPSVATVTTSTSTTPQATAPQNSGGGSPTPLPVLRIVTAGSRVVATQADTVFTATVYDAAGHLRTDATAAWSFGDGMRRSGASVLHQFYESGEYPVVVYVTTPDGARAVEEFVVTAKDAGVAIASISTSYIALVNKSSQALDISFWRLVAGGREFIFPEHTKILAGRTVNFSSKVTGLLATDSAALLYPSGAVAATYPTPATKPSPAPVSYQSVQKVEPVSSTISQPAYEAEAVVAPTASTTVAAVGAPEPVSSGSILTSPWTLGFVGLLIFSGVTLLLL